MATKAAPKKPARPAAKNPAKAKPVGKKKAAKAIDYGSPAQLSVYDTETAQVTAHQAREIDILKQELDDLKDQAAAKAKEHKAALALHFQYMRERALGRGKAPAQDLFGGVPAGDTPARGFAQKLGGKPSANGKAKPKGGKKSATPVTDADGSPDWFPKNLWWYYPIERLTSYGLTAADVEKLKDGVVRGRSEPFPIVNVGDLSDFQKPTAGGFVRKLTDLKGIGEAAAARIENAMITFWANWSGGQGDFAAAFAVENGHKKPDGFTEAGLDDAGNPGRAEEAPGRGDGDGDGPATVPFAGGGAA